MALFSTFFGTLPNPTAIDLVGKLVMFLGRIWLGIIVGVLVGWLWKPKWARLGRDWLDSSTTKESPAPSSSSSPVLALNSLKFQLPCYPSWISGAEVEKEVIDLPPPSIAASSSSRTEGDKSPLVGEEDLEYIFRLVEEKDGGPAWIHMMDKSTSNMNYQAWRRDIKNGPPQYRSKSVYEDANPEMVRDFFWDDEFRLKWDDMLVDAQTLEECSSTGTMVLRWVRKFPLFCSEREYVIGRRIWKSGRAYYCVTKGVQYPSIPRHEKPRRVDLFYSSWCIRPVESRTGDGQLSACEVLLFHYEDMGIPWELAKLGVKQGMWGAVKKIDRGLRLYQNQKADGAPLSHCASMAHLTTKVNPDYLSCLEQNSIESSESQTLESSEKPERRNISKLVVVGGALLLACSLDRGLLTKAVIFGVARRFANIGRRL